MVWHVRSLANRVRAGSLGPVACGSRRFNARSVVSPDRQKSSSQQQDSSILSAYPSDPPFEEWTGDDRNGIQSCLFVCARLPIGGSKGVLSVKRELQSAMLGN